MAPAINKLKKNEKTVKNKVVLSSQLKFDKGILWIVVAWIMDHNLEAPGGVPSLRRSKIPYS